MNSFSLTNLYKTHEKAPPHNDQLENLNLTDFAVNTRADVIHIACVIGSVNCLFEWRAVVTPMGVSNIIGYTV